MHNQLTSLDRTMFGRVVVGSIFIALFILLAQPQPAEKYSGLRLNITCNGWNSFESNIYKNSTDNLKILSLSSSIHLREGLNIHRSIYCHQLFPLFAKSNLNHSWRTSMLIGSGSCSGSLKIKIKIKRHKRPCPYYVNTVNLLHFMLFSTLAIQYSSSIQVQKITELQRLFLCSLLRTIHADLKLRVSTMKT